MPKPHDYIDIDRMPYLVDLGTRHNPEYIDVYRIVALRYHMNGGTTVILSPAGNSLVVDLVLSEVKARIDDAYKVAARKSDGRAKKQAPTTTPYDPTGHD